MCYDYSLLVLSHYCSHVDILIYDLKHFYKSQNIQK